MNITIIGAGYVGLVTGVCMSELGCQVVCVEKDPNKLSLLSQGQVPIYEPELDDLLKRNLNEGRLSFTDDLAHSVHQAEAVFIAVGTPTSRRGDGYADMSFVFEAVRLVAPHLQKGAVVINKSTVPIGSAREVMRIIRETNPGVDFEVASNPEFLREGAAVKDFLFPERIVVGVESECGRNILEKIYQPFLVKNIPVLFTDLETAELIKYASNAFLATKISFINEMANLCETVNANVDDLAKGMGLDSRIGPRFLQAGPGFGGSCFPKDTLALARIAQEHGSPSRIIETVIEVNQAQKARMVKKIREAMGGVLAGKTLAVLGLTFKPETDDMRDAPAITVLSALIEKGVKIRAYDPAGMEEAKKFLSELEYCQDAYQTCCGADALCLFTEWDQFKNMDLSKIKGLLSQAIFIDLRNVYSLSQMQNSGFNYVSVGRPVCIS